MTYLYHGTTAENIPSILLWGLRPRMIGQQSSLPNWRRRGLYVTRKEDNAIGWAMSRFGALRGGEVILRGDEQNVYLQNPMVAKGYTGLYILRFDARLARHIIPDEGIGEFGPEGDAWIVFDTIPPRFIQYRRYKILDPSRWPHVMTDNYETARWRPITDLARQ